MSALDVKPNAYMALQLDRACRSGSRAAEGFCHRIFYPWTGTRTFDYPGSRSTSLRLWLDNQELISATSITSDGVSIPAGTGYLLRPDIGPPFDQVEINRDGSYSFAGGPQRAISITGLWGYSNTETAVTTLAGAIGTTSATSIDVTAPVGGVGAVLRIGQERLQVYEKNWITSPATTSTLASSAAATTISTTDAGLFTPGERILIDGERMEVQDIAGNTMVVRRAVDGSSLAAHTAGTAIFWQHRLLVERGALGTTAATALNGATVWRWECPSPVRALAQAYAEDEFLQQNAGYARTSGSGEYERPVSGAGIKACQDRISPDYRRKVRTRAV